jgi:hypothetical protein
MHKRQAPKKEAQVAKTYHAGIEARLIGPDWAPGMASFEIACSTNFEQLLYLEQKGVTVSRQDTRFSDQSLKTWSFHPLFQEFIDLPADVVERACSVEGDPVSRKALLEAYQNVPALVAGTRACYRLFTQLISRWLTYEKGMSPEDAEKHARAASQGILGQCVTQAIVCSAPVELWLELARTLTRPEVDAEVRIIFGQIAAQLA